MQNFKFCNICRINHKPEISHQNNYDKMSSSGEGRKGFYKMLKAVVYDSGYGGEFFADRLEAELPIIDVIRVIDWRNAEQIQNNSKEARKIAEADLRPYIGHVDLIILANHLLTLTSLKYFRRKYKNQHFVGLNLRKPTSPPKNETIVLTTKPVAKTINYYNFIFHMRKKITTITLDTWPAKIDDGELTEQEIKDALGDYAKRDARNQEVFLGCSQFYDLKPELIKIFGRNLKIHDGFNDVFKETCKILRIRGGKQKVK